MVSAWTHGPQTEQLATKQQPAGSCAAAGCACWHADQPQVVAVLALHAVVYSKGYYTTEVTIIDPL